jgi:hypothetical protein
MLAPSKRNKLFVGTKHEGSFCFATMVSGVYQWYIPMFVYACKKAYPDAGIKIVVRGNCELPEIYNEYVTTTDAPNLTDDIRNAHTTAALRFTRDYEGITNYDYALITDIDLLHRVETNSIVQTRMIDLTTHNLKCYSNYVSGQDLGEDRMPGVHFVTREWWHTTAEARKKWQEILLATGADSYSFDERMLTKIVKESGLPTQKGEMKFWQMHGLHLGDWRKKVQSKNQHYPPVPGYDQLYIRECLVDACFMRIADECAKHIPTITQTLALLKSLTTI